jgi:hypothetical protein
MQVCFSADDIAKDWRLSTGRLQGDIKIDVLELGRIRF